MGFAVFYSLKVGRRPHWLAVVMCLLFNTQLHATQFSWLQPDLDWLSYVNAIGAGNRAFGPSWIGGLELDGQTNEFVPKGRESPSRLGMPLVAFDTSSDVVTGLPPSQYQINSVTLTMTMASATFPSEFIFYDDTPDTQAEVLADIQSGSFDSQRPMELYGVGFREGYIGFEFAVPASDPVLLDESTQIYGASDGGYLAYPISSDATGQPLDVSNSITGGFSETAPANTTPPFDPVPWSIGTTSLSVGDAIPDDTTFTFDVNLAEPGVLDYVQQGLANGEMGFFVSSLTLAAQPGLGIFPYPQWYLKESGGGAVNGIPPTLEIDVTISGDFDEDGDVDSFDLAEWQLRYGVDSGADADSDNDSDGEDFLIWQKNYTGSGALVATLVVPEPASIFLITTILVSPIRPRLLREYR